MNVAPYLPVSVYMPYSILYDPIYAIIIVYCIGVYVGILISMEDKSRIRYESIPEYSIYEDPFENDTKKEDAVNEEPVNEDAVNKEPVNEDAVNEEPVNEDDEDDSDYEPSEHDEEDDEEEDDEEEDDEEEDEEEEEKLTDIDLRDTINKLYIYTDIWEDFVPLKSIYTRVQKLYPDVTKFMIKEAMNLDPRVLTGSKFSVKGYRCMVAI